MDDLAGTGVSLAQALTAAGALVVGVVVSVLLRALLTRSISRGDGGGGAPGESGPAHTLGKLLQVAIILTALLWSLNVLGVRITPLLGALGIGGIAVALAVQSVLGNAIASVILQVRRPFRRGDQIGTGDHEGRVIEVNWRTVRLVTFDGNDVAVPCSSVLDNPITNYTRRANRRTDLVVGLDYDTDLEAARDVVLSALAGVEGVHGSPAPEAWVTEFGDSTIDLTVRYWHDSPNATLWQVRSEVAVAIKRDLDAAGMTIAFPQRVLHLDAGTARLLAGERHG